MFKNDTIKAYQKLKKDEDNKMSEIQPSYNKHQNYQLLHAAFDTETFIALTSHMLILPQCALITRNIISFIELNDLLTSEIEIETIDSFVLLIRFVLILFLILGIRLGMKRNLMNKKV